jgi:hypothetical protein
MADNDHRTVAHLLAALKASANECRSDALALMC